MDTLPQRTVNYNNTKPIESDDHNDFEQRGGDICISHLDDNERTLMYNLLTKYANVFDKDRRFRKLTLFEMGFI